MSFGQFTRRVLAAGFIVSMIFIVVFTGNFAQGAEQRRLAPIAEPQLNSEGKQRSRLHPKRIYSGLKRGVSRLFGRSKKEEPARQPSRAVTARPTVSQQINRIYAKQGVRRPPMSAPLKPTAKSQPALNPRRALPKQTAIAQQPIQQPSVQSPSHSIEQIVKQQLNSGAAEKTETTKTNRFADVDFDNLAPVAKQTPVIRQTRAPKRVQQASVAPAGAPEITHLLGYCPVNLKSGKFQRGKRQFSYVFQGRTYRFGSEAAMNEFIRDPAPYAPVIQGADVIELQRTGRHVPGFLSFSCDYDGRYYLFRSAANQEKFLANPSAYAVVD